MSRTNLTVITEALRLAGVIHEIETPANEDAQDALRRLNDMMLGWDKQKGIKLGFYPQTVLAENIPIGDEYFEVVTLMLAKRIAQHWGASLSPDVATQANESFRSLMAEFLDPGAANLNHVPGNRYGYNIETDT